MDLRTLWRRADFSARLGSARTAWATLLALLAGRPAFWYARRHLLKTEFNFQNIDFRAREAARSLRLELPVLYRFLLVALGGMTIAAAAATVSLSVDYVLHTSHARVLSPGFRLPGLQQPFINATTAAILQLSVIIIGLYAAAFSVVVSTVYGRLHGDIRELLFKDVASNTFLKAMAFLSCYSAFLLLAQSLGLHVGYFSIAILTLAIVYGIRTFVTVGIGVFRLFDPLQLLRRLQLDITDAIKSSTPSGYRYDNPSFQNAYRQRSERDLAALGHMLEVLDRAPQIARIASFVLTLFQYYESVKREIPSSSLWFKRRFQHIDWLTADAEVLTVALNTRTRIPPREVAQDDWFETEAVRILLRGLALLKDLNEPSVLHRFNADFSTAISQVAYVLAVPEGVAFARALLPTLLGFIRTQPDSFDKEAVQLEIADAAAMTCTGLVVGVMHRVLDTDETTISDIITRAYSGRPLPERSWLPKTAYDALNDLRLALRLETAVEGDTVTPPAYAYQLITQHLLRSMWGGIEAAIDLFFTALLPAIDNLIEERRYSCAVIMAQRCHEGSAKLETALADLMALEQRLRPPIVLMENRWPTFDAPAMASRIDELRRTAVFKIADGALASWPTTFDDRLPDLCGQAFHIVAHESFTAMIMGDREFAANLARRFLALALEGIRHLRDRLSEDGFPTWGGQLALDAFELCGYAMMLSALDSTDYWSAYREILDRVFTPDEEGCAKLNAYVALGRYCKNLLAITPRSLVRFYWTRAVEDKLESLGLSERHGSYSPYYPRPSHRNSVIRSILREWRPAESAFDLFVAVYALRRCPSLTSAPDSARELRARLYIERHHRGWINGQGTRLVWARRRNSAVAGNGDGEADETVG